MGRGKRTRTIARPQAKPRVSGATRTVVVPDVHGNPDILLGLLEAAGAIDANGKRLPGVRVVGVGDIVHGTLKSEEGDIACLELAERLFDCSLLGNHEAAVVGLTDFNEVWRGGPVASMVRSLIFRGFFVPALLEGETLLTHGGVAPGFAAPTAKETYEKIMDAWGDGPDGALFTAISHPERTTRPDPAGGIFWLDWREERATAFSQVVGHTPIGDAELIDLGEVFHLNVDAGGKGGRKLVAAVLEDGEPTELVTFERD